MTREWLANAKKHWETNYDWRKCEDRINSYPNFKATVKDSEGNTVELQFLALFSEKSDAIPIGFFHGWPGSIIEFLDLLDILRKRHSPKDLPYHVIVPSLPGYAYSSGPPLDKDYGIDVASTALHSLMMGLGFGSGYLAQGGDIGSFVSQFLSARYEECKGMHLNMIGMGPPENADKLSMSDLEKEALPRGEWFFDQGFAYALEHGTRTATIGLALSASPLAMLSWYAPCHLLSELNINDCAGSAKSFWSGQTKIHRWTKF
jgi:pimeloyl-ACP methyl ester carboxylesterase